MSAASEFEMSSTIRPVEQEPSRYRLFVFASMVLSLATCAFAFWHMVTEGALTLRLGLLAANSLVVTVVLSLALLFCIPILRNRRKDFLELSGNDGHLFDTHFEKPIFSFMHLLLGSAIGAFVVFVLDRHLTSFSEVTPSPQLRLVFLVLFAIPGLLIGIGNTTMFIALRLLVKHLSSPRDYLLSHVPIQRLGRAYNGVGCWGFAAYLVCLIELAFLPNPAGINWEINSLILLVGANVLIIYIVPQVMLRRYSIRSFEDSFTAVAGGVGSGDSAGREESRMNYLATLSALPIYSFQGKLMFLLANYVVSLCLFFNESKTGEFILQYFTN